MSDTRGDDLESVLDSSERSRAAVVVLVALVALVALPVGGFAQTRHPVWELGVDASFWMSWPAEDDRLTTIEVPFSRIRAGRYLSPAVLLEAGGGFAYAEDAERASSAGRVEGAISLHLSGNARGPRVYLLLGGGGRWAAADEVTNWQPYTTGGLGLKLPVGRVLGVRIEADYGRAFETAALSAAHEVRGLLGMSFYPGP
ncbi:MAG: hypothetical protein R3195_03220 [Gemmatimonadota bacterium]|nr:hypothetical protein [Gemmatimonadota bacterium]